MNAVLDGAPAAGARGRFEPLTPLGVAATIYLGAVGAVFAGWHAAESAWSVPPCAAPALLAAVLAATSQHDRRQYAARLMAALLMLPLLLLFFSLDGNSGWLAPLAFAVVHAAVFVLTVCWMASFSTRIEAPAGAAAASAGLLRQRLASLPALGLPLAAQVAPAGVRLQWQPANEPGRSHVVTLRLDAAARTVAVTERLRADAATPLSAAEASMHDGFGADAFDPTRPQASRVWLRVAQTTMLDDERLAAAPVALAGEQVVWRGPGAAALPDSDTLMACLAVIVLDSGWSWRPAF
jgi:hypothetical protein